MRYKKSQDFTFFSKYNVYNVCSLYNEHSNKSRIVSFINAI